ncbi:MAG: hypothetical protein ACPGU4_09780 [Flavobacteriales bacterium]
MQKYLLLFGLLAFGFWCGCKPTLHNQITYPEKLEAKDSVIVNVEALNLSEDVSRFSTKDDEVLVLVYGMTDTTVFPEPILVGYSVFDSNAATHQFQGEVPRGWRGNSVGFFLIEVDSEKSPEEIQVVFRTHHAKILEAYRIGDVKGLRHFIEDDDLLGYEVTTNIQIGMKRFEFSGVQKLDQFHYRIELDFRAQK